MAQRRGPTRSTFVYFIQADTLGLIKIGVAVDPEDRLSTLQCGSPDRLTLRAVIQSDHAIGLEGALHRQFAEHRSHGEWFRPAPELLAHIATHASEYVELISRGQAELASAILSRTPRRFPGEPRVPRRAHQLST